MNGLQITHMENGDMVLYPDGRTDYYPGGLRMSQWRRIQSDYEESVRNAPRRTAYDELLPEGAEPVKVPTRFCRAARRAAQYKEGSEHEGIDEARPNQA